MFRKLLNCKSRRMTLGMFPWHLLIKNSSDNFSWFLANQNPPNARACTSHPFTIIKKAISFDNAGVFLLNFKVSCIIHAGTLIIFFENED